MEIKPCAFCDSEDVVLDDSGEWDSGPMLYWVQCTNCLATGPRNLNDQVAIQMWNEVAERIQTLMDQLKKLAEGVVKYSENLKFLGF